MRIKQCFAVLIYRRRLYNYLFIGMGVFRAFRLFGRAGCVCVRDVLAHLASALALLCDFRQLTGDYFLLRISIRSAGARWSRGCCGRGTAGRGAGDGSMFGGSRGKAPGFEGCRSTSAAAELP